MAPKSKGSDTTTLVKWDFLAHRCSFGRMQLSSIYLILTVDNFHKL